MEPNTIYKVKTLGKCPECGSLRLGIIKPEVPGDYERQMKRYFRKYHCFLKFTDPREWDGTICANRFCMDCKYEWREEENFFKTNRFGTLYFSDKEEYKAYMEESCYKDEKTMRDFHSVGKKKRYFKIFKKGGFVDRMLIKPVKRLNIFSDFR